MTVLIEWEDLQASHREVNVNVEIELMLLQAKEHQRLPANYQSCSKLEPVLLRALKRNQPCLHLDL